MKCCNYYCEKEALDHGKYCKACSYIRRVGYQAGINSQKRKNEFIDEIKPEFFKIIKKMMMEELENARS